MNNYLFYWTGFCVWCFILLFAVRVIKNMCVLIYKRHIKQTLGNLKFILFGSKSCRSYYAWWLSYRSPGIRKFWLKKKYLRRWAYKALVRRAWRERHEHLEGLKKY